MEDRPATPQTPQQKKAHSYAKDRRYCYGESNKASRKIVPRYKARENRDARRKVVQSMATLGQLDDVAAAVAESSARHDLNRVGGWRKSPDLALGKHIARQAVRRERHNQASVPHRTSNT